MIGDFGLARAVDDATLTRSGFIAGTPHYMSPEQASGETIDSRADLFSLGSVLYFACTGHPPFRADGPLAVLHRICRDKHRSVCEANSAVPKTVAKIIDRLLEKKPKHRFENASQVRETLAIQLTLMQNSVSDDTSDRVVMRAFRKGWRPMALVSGLALVALLAIPFAERWISGHPSVSATQKTISNTDIDSGSIPDTTTAKIPQRQSNLKGTVSGKPDLRIFDRPVPFRASPLREPTHLPAPSSLAKPRTWEQRLDDVAQDLRRIESDFDRLFSVDPLKE